MQKRTPLKLDTELVEKLGEVLKANKFSNVKVRRLVIDIEDRYGWGRTRVTVVGGRSRWDHSVEITKIDRVP